MKKIFLILTIVFCLYTTNVYGASIKVSLNCPKTSNVGETITCTINSNTTDGYLSGLKGNYEISNGSFKEFNVGRSFITYASTDKGFVVGNTSGGVKDNNTIGTIKITPNVTENNNIIVKLINLNASDSDYNDYDLSDASASINIIKKEEVKEELYLDSLKIVGYNINFNKKTYKYNLEINDNIESITINGSSKNNTITGLGTFELKNGINTFKVVVKNEELKLKEKVYTITINKLVIDKDNVLNDEENVSKALNKFNEISINLDINKDELFAYKNILDKIINTDKIITYNIFDNNKLLYSFIFNGKEIDYVLDNMSLMIDFNKENLSKELKDIIKDDFLINMSYRSYLPNKTILKIYDIELNKNINLYRININNNLELVLNNLKYDNKNIEFEVERGNIFVIGNYKNVSIDSNEKDFDKTILVIQTILVIFAILESIFITYKYIKIIKKRKY